MEEKRKMENSEMLDPEDLEQVSGGAVLSDTLRVIKNIRKVRDTVKNTVDNPEKAGETTGAAMDGAAHGVDQVMARVNSFAGHK